MKNFLHILLLSLTLHTAVQAQSNLTVSVTVNVLPPYSDDILDMVRNPGRLQVTLHNNFFQDVDIRLLGRITGDNGVSVATDPNYRPARPITLKGYQTLILTSRDVETMFDRNHLDIQGLDTRNFDRGVTIPEGNYQFCVQVFQYNGNLPLSQDFPLGCSAIFPIIGIQPPILVSPICDQEVTPLHPQNLVFSWTPAVGINPADAVYTLRVVELPLSGVEPNAYIDAMQLPPMGFEEKNIRGTSFVYTASHPPLKKGKKYAWRVQVFDAKKLRTTKTNAKSPVCTFQYGQLVVVNNGGGNPAGPISGIELKEPLNKSTVETEVAGGGGKVTLFWKLARRAADNNPVNKYRVEVAEVPANTTPEAALTQARNSGKLTADMTVQRYKDDFEDGIAFAPPLDLGTKLKVGKTYAWQVRGSEEPGDLNLFKSEVWSFTVSEGTNLNVSEITELFLNGFPIKINNNNNGLTQSTANKFKAHGTIKLWENGPEFNIQCQNWKVRPILKDGKKTWIVISGELHTEGWSITNTVAKKCWLNNLDVPGEFKFLPTNLDIVANTAVQKDGALYKVTFDGGTSKLKGQFSWLTELLLNHPTVDGGSQALLKSRTGDLDISYTEKLKGSLLLQAEFNETTAENFQLRLLGDSYFAVQGLTASMHLNGTVSVPDARPDLDKDLKLTFMDEQDLLFTGKDLNYELPVDKNGLVSVLVKQCTVFLSGNTGYSGAPPTQLPGQPGLGGGVNWGALGNNLFQPGFTATTFVLKAKLESETMEIELPNLSNRGYGFFCNEKDQKFNKQKAKVGGLAAQFTSGGIYLTKSRLAKFTAEGKIFVPFLNVKGDVNLLFTEKDKPVGAIKLPDNYESLLVKNNDETQQLWLKCSYLEYVNGKVHISPQFKLLNTNDKGVQSNQYLSVADMVIRPDGSLANEKSFTGANLFYFQWQEYGKYRGFNYKFSSLKTAKTATGYRMEFGGQIVFTQNVSTTGTQNVVFEFDRNIDPPAGFGAVPEEPVYDDWAALTQQRGGPSYEAEADALEWVEGAATVTDIAIKDDGVEAKHEGPTGSFGGKFTYFLGDDVYGTGFKLEAECTIKEPQEGKIKAKVMIGKALQGFVYWYFEAGQQDVVTIPLFAGFEAYAFSGRVYYHMKHQNSGGNITDNNYIPSKDIGLGVYADMKVSSQDKGKLLWGKLALEITTLGSGGLNSVHLFGDAQILCEDGKETKGQLNGVLNSYYDFINDEFLTSVKVTGGVYNSFCINGSADLEMYAGPGDGNWHLYFGQNTPAGWTYASAKAFCSDIGANAGAYLFLDSDGLKMGLLMEYNSGWKGVSVGDWAGVAGKFSAKFTVDGQIQFSPLNISGKAVASGAAYGKGCLLVCYEESARVKASLSFSAPNPVCLAGNVTVDVPVIPTFTIGARFKDGAFSFDNDCN